MSINELNQLMATSYSPFHVVKNLKDVLESHGFLPLDEKESYPLEKGKKYYVTRNGSSLIAFEIGKDPLPKFQIAAAHTDSPTYKLKPQPLIFLKDYVSLNVEPYGGVIHPSWMDRPLSIAGRVLLSGKNRTRSELFYVDSDLLIIPSLAIHMDRTINTGHNFNPAVDMIPLFSAGSFPKDKRFEDFLLAQLEKQGKVKDEEEVSGFDLFLVNRVKPTFLGYEGELFASPKEDDLTSVYSALLGFVESKENPTSIKVLACFDNEEVGSLTKQGADSSFLRETLKRILVALGYDSQWYERSLASSMLLSIDNAHALHPNYPSYMDETSPVYLKKGIVIKYNANQSYTSDGFSSTIAKKIAALAEVPYQEYTNRSDLRGGSTLGNLSNAQVSLTSVDIGIPQLSMHSSYEVLAKEDIESMISYTRTYYSTDIVFVKDGVEYR